MSTTELRMREALRDAMAEEMRRDQNVFVMGEDVGVFQGAFKVTEGLLDELGVAIFAERGDQSVPGLEHEHDRGVIPNPGVGNTIRLGLDHHGFPLVDAADQVEVEAYHAAN